MSDRGLAALEAFVRGELGLAELEPALRDAAAGGATDKTAVSARLAELHRENRLPAQVYTALLQSITAGEALDGTGPGAQRAAADEDPDATRRKPPVPSGGSADATRAQPAAGPSSASAGATSAAADPAPRAGGDETRLAPRTATGSNWAHPEQWTEHHTGAIGPGTVIKSRFVLESELGRGGMGVVYKALDRRKQEARDRNPYVAIKILSEEFRKHPDALIALQRESVKVQNLAHPNIVTVHDFDRDGTTVYMTMELLEGQPLDELIAANAPGGIPKETALPLIRDMGEALAYAHRKGVVHSDFKPGNVFLTDQGELKVLDFGIARAVPAGLQAHGDDTAFDARDLGALTKTYASAEMLRGETPSPADDVFALGLVAHELLTGRHAFDRTPADEARRQGRTPSAIPGITRRQRNAVSRALALDRERRPADARAFVRRLQGPPPVQKALAATIVLVLAASVAWVLYERAQLRPDVPFESLPAGQQQEFRAAISDGRDALRREDWALESALTYFSAAYDIHRNNPEAVAGLRATADRFLEATRDLEPALKQRSFDLLLCQEYLSSYEPVLSECRDVLPAGECACASGD